MNILAQIFESKKLEIKALHERYDLRKISEEVTSSHLLTSPSPLFYQRLAEARAEGQAFFITEFKRKSPSEGWINRDADLPAQILAYMQAGAGAISVLTDEPFFGGNYADLKLARQVVDGGRFTVDGTRFTVDGGRFTVDGGRFTVNGGRLTMNRDSVHRPPSTVNRKPLLLQKDFILDPLQIYLAKLHGADLILLIAAILEPDQLDYLRKAAESIGLGVLVEVHDAEELEKIQHLDFQVLGINNRDLKTFRTSLNRVNVLKQKAGERFVIAESGVLDNRHFQMVRNADGFLIGTGLMRNSKAEALFSLQDHFQSQGRFLFKACGIRTVEMLGDLTTLDGLTAGPDFIGINFSPLSKRRANLETSEVLKTSEVSSAVAVFYQNTEEDIREILQTYPFKTVQLYAGDVSPAFIRSLRQRVILAVRFSEGLTSNEGLTSGEALISYLEPYAADVDCFILDGASPGSGERIGAKIPFDFPYPFLLAGGMQEENLEALLAYKNCIGVDVASGIETGGIVDLGKIERIAQRLLALPLPHDLPNRL